MREKTGISLQGTNEEEVTTITLASVAEAVTMTAAVADVAVTTSAAVKKQLASERTMKQTDYFMEHIMQRHVHPLQYRENSFFLSTDKQYICAMVTETMKEPDTILRSHVFEASSLQSYDSKSTSKEIVIQDIR